MGAGKMKLRKKPGMIRGFLVIVLVVLYVIAIFQKMGDGEQLDMFLVAVPVLVLLILLAELIAGKIYPSKDEELRRIVKDLRSDELDEPAEKKKKK